MKYTLIIFVSSFFVSCVYSPRTDKSSSTTNNNYYGDNKHKLKDDDYVQYKQNDNSVLTDDAPFYNDGLNRKSKPTVQVTPERSVVTPERSRDKALVVHNSQYVPYTVIPPAPLIYNSQYIPYTVIPPTVHYTVPVANRSIYYVER